ncbi:MAG: DUF1345 domain-containing protein [Burkholderiales bacterium]|nr:DUF1345 domain-containing protein [Burkholderiales bacterium]
MYLIRKFIRHRQHLALTFGIGVLAAVLLPAKYHLVTRALFGWDVGVWLYLLLMGWLMARASHHRVRKMALEEDENAVTVLALLSLSATISLAAIVLELSGMKGVSTDMRILKYLFTGATVLGSWGLLAVIFCFHYALLFYNSPEERRALRFPEDEQAPDYWDFLYFSFTIAVAAQTSDISVASRQMRKTVLAQSVLSFLFNIAVLGFSINIAAGLVGN